jgi:RNase P protein component
VFIAKGGPDTESSATETGSLQTYALVVRARNEVQEIAVQSELSREELKAALELATIKMLDEAPASSDADQDPA